MVIVSSVALYTWLQKKDRDGAKGLLAGLKTPESMRLIRLSGGLIAALALLLRIGTLFAGNPVASG